jgi:putative thioredoxin
VSTSFPPSRVPLRGAVDLAAVAAAREAQAAAEQRLAAGEVPPPASLVVEVTEATFQTEIIDRSFQVPVIIHLGTARSQASALLAPVLEKLALDDAGAWLLAAVDAELEPRIAQALQAQAVPTVYAIIKQQPMVLFEGVADEAQIRGILDEVLRVAAASGLTGRVGDDALEPAEPAEPESDPRYDLAYDAIEVGDWDAADAAYRDILSTHPADEDARAGLGQVALLRRTDGADPVELLAAADAAPDSVEAQSLAADIELLTGRVDEAFARMLELVRRTSGDERTAAKDHLIALFALVGDADPRVGKARTALANALF